MSFFLDTNICIYALKGLFPQIPEYFKKVEPKDIKIPSIVVAELFYGLDKSNQAKNTEKILLKFLSPLEIVDWATP